VANSRGFPEDFSMMIPETIPEPCFWAERFKKFNNTKMLFEVSLKFEKW